MSLLGLLVVLIVLGLIYWAATRLMSAFGIGEPVYTVVVVLLVVLTVLYLLSGFGILPSTGLRLR